MTVNTAKVPRRELHFESLDAVVREAERLAAAERIVTHGNWTLGQILHHLAQLMHMSIDGARFRAPWYVRLVGPLLKRRILRGMPAGFDLPPAAVRQLAADGDVEVPEAVDSLSAAVARLCEDPHRAPHPVLGRMSLEEWNELHLRHAELHLGFVDTA